MTRPTGKLAWVRSRQEADADNHRGQENAIIGAPLCP
jgi:hypothetical protein